MKGSITALSSAMKGSITVLSRTMQGSITVLSSTMQGSVSFHHSPVQSHEGFHHSPVQYHEGFHPSSVSSTCEGRHCATHLIGSVHERVQGWVSMGESRYERIDESSDEAGAARSSCDSLGPYPVQGITADRVYAWRELHIWHVCVLYAGERPGTAGGTMRSTSGGTHASVASPCWPAPLLPAHRCLVSC